MMGNPRRLTVRPSSITHRQSSKGHSTYFELREALERPGCVVCRLAARSVRRYLEALTFESVNDVGLRRQLRRARGFCNLHAWQLLQDAREPFGTAILYRDVLHSCVLALKNDIQELAGRGACPACVARDEAATRYVEVLAEHLEEERLGAALATAGGLCWRHFLLGLARGGRGLVTLAEIERVALNRSMDGDRQAAAVASRPGAGIRAGTAAPRPTSDDEIGDPSVGLAAGLRGVFGPALENSKAWAWPEAEAAGLAASVSADDGDCVICVRAGRAAESAAERAGAGGPVLDLCPPHTWLALDRSGSVAVRKRLAPALALLREEIDGALVSVEHARGMLIGPFVFAGPAARRARRELAARLSPGRECAVCQAQLLVEDDCDASRGALCRPHLLSLGREGRGPVDGRVVETSRAAWQAIVGALDEYVRKSDYRFREEPRGGEQRAPWLAVAAVAAATGVR